MIRSVETDADLDAWVAVKNAVVPDEPTTTQQVRGAAAEGRILLLAERDGALIEQHKDDTAEHAMTGVARAARGRGVALALKQAQIAAAKSIGLAWLRTQNDLGNAPMRRVNEQLGYVKRFEWVHLTGPLLRR